MLRSAVKAFTLIELLIVVAIIAILAAIAVPNFLEAQTRAKVSRVRNDMRTIATGMESYLVDHNKYPNDSDNTPGKGGENGLIRLTTPVAYISSFPRDPFQSMVDPTLNDSASFYEIGSGSDNEGWGNEDGVLTPNVDYGSRGVPRASSFLITSVGTDVNPVNLADDTNGNDEFPYSCTCLTYDPTNGTVSDGDIYRAGGELGEGNYTVNGVLRGKF